MGGQVIAKICEAVGLEGVAMWLRAERSELRLEDATKHSAKLAIHGLRCGHCGKHFVDGDDVTWLSWPNGERSAMLHVACDRKLECPK